MVLDRALPGGPVMYGTRKVEVVIYVSSWIRRVTKRTRNARTSDVHQSIVPNDDVGNGSGGIRDVRHSSRLDE